MKKTRLITAVFLAFLISGCQNKEEAKPDSETINSEAKLETRAAGQADYEETKYYFRLPNYKGGEIDLRDHAGKPALIMFFTETCPYCRKAAPFINSIYAKYASKGLPVIGISLRGDVDGARSFAKDFGLKFDIAYNGGETSRKYGIQGVPFIYLLDKKHSLAKTWAGYDESYDPDIDSEIKKNI